MVIPVGTRPFCVPVPFTLIWGDTDIIPSRPFKLEGHEYLVHASHAAPILAAEISGIFLNFLHRS